MWHLLVRTDTLRDLDGDSRFLAYLRFLYPALALDGIDPARVDWLDDQGAEWTDCGGGPHAYDAEHVARLGTVAANLDAMMAAAGPVRFEAPAYTELDVEATRARIEAVVAPAVTRQDADGTPFADRADLDAVLAEQGTQTGGAPLSLSVRLALGQPEGAAPVALVVPADAVPGAWTAAGPGAGAP